MAPKLARPPRRAKMSNVGDGGWMIPPPFFNPFHLQSWVTFLVLGPAFINYADGCIRRSLFQPQTSSTTPRPTPTSPMDDTTGTTMASSHKHPCLEEEVQSINCLHGGTCQAVILNNNNRQSLCHCTSDWTGPRCEYVFIDPSILANMERNMRTANIAAGVSVCILVIFVLLLAIYVYLRKKHRKKRSETQSHDLEATATLEPNGRAAEGGKLPAPGDSEIYVSIDDDGATSLKDHSAGGHLEEKRPLPAIDVIEPTGPSPGPHPATFTGKESSL